MTTPGDDRSPGRSPDRRIEAFWADARVRAKLHRLEAVTGQSSAASLAPPAWAFGDDPAMADELLELVLTGRKTATASALRDYEQEARERAQHDEDGGPGAADSGGARGGDVLTAVDVDLMLPEPGDLGIILDGRGHPQALIRLTGVEVVRFGDVSADHARREGEGDRSLAHWREVHADFFARSSARDEPVDEDTMVVLERFELLVPRPGRMRGSGRPTDTLRG